MGAMNHHGAEMSMPGNKRFCKFMVALAPFAQAAFQRDNSSPRFGGGGDFGQFERRFRQFLGDTQEMLAALHFAPDILRPNAGRSPQDGEIVEQIGALAD